VFALPRADRTACGGASGARKEDDEPRVTIAELCVS
jgi:hypothetical protein